MKEAGAPCWGRGGSRGLAAFARRWCRGSARTRCRVSAACQRHSVSSMRHLSLSMRRRIRCRTAAGTAGYCCALSVLQLVVAHQDCVEEFVSNLVASRHLNSVDVVKLEAREALSNALCHSRAREVEHAVHLRQISPHLRVVKQQIRFAWLRMDWNQIRVEQCR